MTKLIALIRYALDHYWLLIDAAIFGAAFATAMRIGNTLPYDESISRALLIVSPIAVGFVLVLAVHAFVNRRKPKP